MTARPSWLTGTDYERALKVAYHGANRLHLHELAKDGDEDSVSRQRAFRLGKEVTALEKRLTAAGIDIDELDRLIAQEAN